MMMAGWNNLCVQSCYAFQFWLPGGGAVVFIPACGWPFLCGPHVLSKGSKSSHNVKTLRWSGSAQCLVGRPSGSPL